MVQNTSSRKNSESINHKLSLTIAILGAGPAGLFMFKRLIELNNPDIVIHIFERKDQIGAGFPYSKEGAEPEHVTNVSGNEIPELVNPLTDWIDSLPNEILDQFNIDKNSFNEFKVLPRLLFGKYLEDQFALLLQQASSMGITTHLHTNTLVVDVIDHKVENNCTIITVNEESYAVDKVIICSGHHWPTKHEGIVPGYFESPYPPSKLINIKDCSVAIRGSSLTAIDAIRTLAKHNGSFKNDDSLSFTPNSKDFKITMFSRNGFLPAVRFHLDDSHLSKDDVLSVEEIINNRAKNNGFLSLDFVFETKFKEPLKDKQPAFYEKIKALSIEKFVERMLSLRENVDAFNLLEAEYKEAEKSIRNHESVYWKEMLAVLSFVMNYPAKYFSAEDMLRLQKTLMPLISVIIAFVPQNSVQYLLALHKAGVLDLLTAGDESYVDPNAEGGATYRYVDESGTKQKKYFDAFVDCIGQPHLTLNDIPYKGICNADTISQARVRFREQETGKREMNSGNEKVKVYSDNCYYLDVPGIRINDFFQVINEYGEASERIFMMAVPYIGGFNPDYSGLDFGEAASAKAIECISLLYQQKMHGK